MKRNLLVGIIGLASTASVLSQGHILVWNYANPPYNQIVWDANFPTVGGQPVNDDQILIQIWFGEGSLADPTLLQPGESFFVNPTYTYNGGGYFDPQLQSLTTWDPGDTFTFQLRVYGRKPAYDYLSGSSVLWTEQGQIVSITEEAQYAALVPGVVAYLPEPSSLALAGAGLGAVLLGMLRRRRSSGV